MSRGRRRSPMRIALALIVVLVAACSGGSSATTRPEPAPQVTPEPTLASGSRRVSKADYGKAWPFTFASGILRCHWEFTRPMVTFRPTDSTVEFGLNGAARGVGEFATLPKKLLKKGAFMTVTQPLIDDGLEICGYEG